VVPTSRPRWLALRGYGRTTVRDWLAATYGGGISILTTGMVTVTAHAGTAVSYPNDHFVPYLAIGFALAVPLAEGKSFGDMDKERYPPAAVRHRLRARGAPRLHRAARRAHERLPSSHDLSLDLGFAYGLRRNTGFASLSIADQVHR
jgi:hypothetical protein